MITPVATSPDSDEPAGRARAASVHASELEAKRQATATQLVATLEAIAETFDHTAALAEQEAGRRSADGREDADEELRAAARAREAAKRARSHADEWRRSLRKPA
jgi:hypothetical protein